MTASLAPLCQHGAGDIDVVSRESCPVATFTSSMAGSYHSTCGCAVRPSPSPTGEQHLPRRVEQRDVMRPRENRRPVLARGLRAILPGRRVEEECRRRREGPGRRVLLSALQKHFTALQAPPQHEMPWPAHRRSNPRRLPYRGRRSPPKRARSAYRPLHVEAAGDEHPAVLQQRRGVPRARSPHRRA